MKPSSSLTDLVSALPVSWARLYTFGLPAEQRHARILQIRSDVYEQMVTARASNASWRAALEILACLAASIYDDVTWRLSAGRTFLSSSSAQGRPVPRAATALLGFAALLAFVRLSSVHHLPEREHLLLIAAVLLGPSLAVLAFFARGIGLGSALSALVASAVLLGAAGLQTILGPVAAALGAVLGALYLIETTEAAPDESADVPGPVSDQSREEDFAMTKLERWLSLGGILFAIALVFFAVAMSGDSHTNNSDEEILAYFGEGHSARAYLSVLAMMAGVLGLLAFFGSLYASARRAEGEGGFLAPLSLAGAAMFSVLMLVAVALGNVTAISVSFSDDFKAGGVDVQVVRLIDNLMFILIAMAAIGAAVAVGGIAIVALKSEGVLNKWLARAGALVAVLLLLTFPLFGMPVAIFAIWVVVVSVWRVARGVHLAAPARTLPA